MGFVKEPGIDQFRPALCNLVAELVLETCIDTILQRLVGQQQRIDTRAFENDPALQSNGDITGVNMPANAIGTKQPIQVLQDFRARHLLAIDRNGFTFLKADGDAQACAGHSSLGRLICQVSAPGDSNWSISLPEMVTPNRFSLIEYLPVFCGIETPAFSRYSISMSLMLPGSFCKSLMGA